MAKPAEGVGTPLDAEAYMEAVDSGQGLEPAVTSPDAATPETPVSPALPTGVREPTIVLTEGELQGMRIEPGQPMPAAPPPTPDAQLKQELAELRQRQVEQDKGIQKALADFAETRKERDALKEQLAERDRLFTPPSTRGVTQWPGQQFAPPPEEEPLVPQELLDNPEELARHLADVTTVQAQQLATTQQQLVQLQNAFVSEYNQRAYRDQYESVKRVYNPLLKQAGIDFPDYGTVQRIADSQGYWNTSANPIQEAINMYIEVKAEGIEKGASLPATPASPAVEEPPPSAGLKAAPVSGHPARAAAPRFQPGAAAPASEQPTIYQGQDGRADWDEAFRQARLRAGIEGVG